jgi:hypothetical protein
MQEITFSGRAGSTLRGDFDDCKVTAGPDSVPVWLPSPGLCSRSPAVGVK